VEEGAPELGDLSDADLQALRLGAEIMGHKATLENRPLVADYFQRLEHLVRERIQVGTTDDDRPSPGVGTSSQADAEDRRLIAEYLELMASNERLSPALRDACRRLRADVQA
jgi:hypothetical protein